MKKWRLETLSKNINLNEIVADIGTDHAFLAIYLFENKLANKIYASDNKEGPLVLAKRNILKRNIKDITLILGDGLEPYGNIKVDTFVIAGMGGKTISNIIKKSKTSKLILEPRNDFDTLRSLSILLPILVVLEDNSIFSSTCFFPSCDFVL